MRYTVERFEGGLLVERTTYDFGEVVPPDPPSLPNADALAAEGVVLRGPWGDDIKLP